MPCGVFTDVPCQPAPKGQPNFPFLLVISSMSPDTAKVSLNKAETIADRKLLIQSFILYLNLAACVSPQM